MKHSPEPWIFEEETGRLYAEANARWIGDIGSTGQDTVEEAIGDGYLCAAAPDLYNCVKHILIASEDNGDFNDIDFKMLRKAIKKANGKTI